MNSTEATRGEEYEAIRAIRDMSSVRAIPSLIVFVTCHGGLRVPGDEVDGGRAVLRWIIERRVTREDRISQDGKSWQRVGDVPDLVPFFDIVDSAERARRADTPGPMVLPAPPPMAATPVLGL